MLTSRPSSRWTRGPHLPAECRTPIVEPSVGAITPASTAPQAIVERVRRAIAARHYSRRTERAYVGWLRRFIAFHAGRPCEEMGAAEVVQFLSALASRGRVTASTPHQALSALLFAYRDVLGRELEGLDAIRAKPSVRLPVVLSREEVTAV